MSDSLSLDTSSAINALSALEKKFGNVLKSVKRFSTSFDADTFKATKETLATLKTVAVQIQSTSEAIDAAADSVSKSFRKLGGSKDSLKGAKTFEQLSKIISKFNTLQGVDTSALDGLSQSVRVISKSMSSMNGVSFDATGIEKGLRSLDDVFKKISVVGSSVNRTPDSINFDPTKIELLKSISVSISKLSVALRKFPDTNSIKDNGGRVVESVKQVRSIFNRLSKAFSGTMQVNTNGMLVVVELANSQTLAVRKVADTLKKFMVSMRESMKGFGQKSLDKIVITLYTLRTSIINVFRSVSKLFDGIASVKTDKNASGSFVVTLAQSKTLAVEQVIKALIKFSNSVLAVKNSWSTSMATNVSKILKALGTSVVSLFNSLSSLFHAFDSITGTNNGGYANKIVQYADSQVIAVVHVTNALSRLVSAVSSISGSFNSSMLSNIESYIQLLRQSVVHLFNDLSTLFTAVNQTSVNSTGGTDTKIVETTNSQALAVRRISDALLRFMKVVNVSTKLKPATIATTLATIKNSVIVLFKEVSNLNSAMANNPNSPNAGSIASVVEGVKAVSTVLGRFTFSVTKLNSINPQQFNKALANIRVQIKLFIHDLGGMTNIPSFANFSKLAEAFNKLAVALKTTAGTASRAKKQLEDLSGVHPKFGKLTSIIKQFFTAFTGFSIIYSTARAIQSSLSSLSNLEMAMARVNTIARASKPILAQWSDHVRNMSVAYGMDRNDLAKALYDINSATITGSRAMFVLEASVRAARAGFTETGKVAELLSKAINAYGYAASDAGRLSDILFKTVERGINPMEELVQYMGRLLTVANNAGVTFEEVNAAIATLTVNGFQTNIATTALNSSFLKLAQGNDKLNALFQQFGYESAAAAIRVEGFGYALAKIKEATGGTTESLTKLGFNYRDIRAMSVLASGGLDEYLHNLKEMENAGKEGTATSKALEEVTGTLAFKWDVVKQAVQDAFIAIQNWAGSSDFLKGLLDSVIGFANAVRNVFNNAKQLDSVLQSLASTVSNLVKVFIAYKATTMNFSTHIAMWGKLKTAIDFAKIALAKYNHMQIIAGRTGLSGFGALIFKINAFTKALFGARLAVVALKASLTFGISLAIDAAISALLYWIGRAQNITRTGKDTEESRQGVYDSGKSLEENLNALKGTKYLQRDDINQAKDALAAYIEQVKQLKATVEAIGDNATVDEKSDLASAEVNVKRYQEAMKLLEAQEKKNRRETARYINLQHSLQNIEKSNKKAVDASTSAMSKYVTARAKVNDTRKALEKAGIDTSALDVDPAAFSAQMKAMFEAGEISPELQNHITALSVGFSDMANNIRGAASALNELQSNLEYLAGISPKKDSLFGLLNTSRKSLDTNYILKVSNQKTTAISSKSMDAYRAKFDKYRGYPTLQGLSDSLRIAKENRITQNNLLSRRLTEAQNKRNMEWGRYTTARDQIAEGKRYILLGGARRPQSLEDAILSEKGAFDAVYGSSQERQFNKSNRMKEYSALVDQLKKQRSAVDSVPISSKELGAFAKNNPELAKKIDEMKTTDSGAVLKLVQDELKKQQESYVNEQGTKRFAELQRMYASGDPDKMLKAVSSYVDEFGGKREDFQASVLDGPTAIAGAVEAVKKGMKIEDYTAQFRDSFANEEEYKKWVEGLKKGSDAMAKLKHAFDDMAADMKKFTGGLADSLLSPEMQRAKKEKRAEELRAKLESDMLAGYALQSDEMKEWQALTQELANASKEFTVPATITSTKAVEAGSEQAFNMIAKQVFAGKTKPEERQVKLLQKSVEFGEKMTGYLEKLAENTAKGLVPVYSGGK